MTKADVQYRMGRGLAGMVAGTHWGRGIRVRPRDSASAIQTPSSDESVRTLGLVAFVAGKRIGRPRRLRPGRQGMTRPSLSSTFASQHKAGIKALGLFGGPAAPAALPPEAPVIGFVSKTVRDPSRKRTRLIAATFPGERDRLRPRDRQKPSRAEPVQGWMSKQAHVGLRETTTLKV
jgi:hypothetical protein